MLESISVIRRYFSLLLIFSAGWFTAPAQTDSLAVVEDLELRFLALPGESNIYGEDLAGFFLDRNETFDYLRICQKEKLNLWVNGQLAFPDYNCSLLSRQQLWADQENDSLYLVLDGLSSEISAELLSTSGLMVGDLMLKPERKAISKDVLVIVSLVLLAFAVLIKLSGRSFNLSIAFSMQAEGVSAYQLVLEGTFLSLIFGANYWIMKSGLNSLSIFEGLMEWLTGAFLVLLLLVAKYLLIVMMVNLNAFRGLTMIQMIAFVRFFILFSLILFGAFFVKFWMTFYQEWTLAGWWNYYYLALYGVFVVLFFFNLYGNITRKKLHIFSYLCTTEFFMAYILSLAMIN
jgi:hypothetical protein